MAERMKNGDHAGHTAGECCGGSDCSSKVREHMNVIASCGKKVGVVDRVEGDSIKLTKKDSPDGQHHHIPMEWVAEVDDSVHLSKNSEETAREWQATPMASRA